MSALSAIAPGLVQPREDSELIAEHRKYNFLMEEITLSLQL
jgi:hypothetical protein